MLRIVSDLHIYDGSSRIRDLTQLDPLLQGVDHLIINGDSCDTQVGATPEQVAEMRRYFAGRVPTVTFLTGNHDPDISDDHEYFLADGRVWMTHGDIFFPDATPWSRLLPELRRRIRAAREGEPTADLEQVEHRLRIFRRICHGLPIAWDLRRRDLFSQVHRLIFDFGSPLRLLAVLNSWRQAPDLAARLAAAQRASAQVVVFGHIHLPSIHRRGNRFIINTGAFGPLGARCVDVTADGLSVRAIDFRQQQFRPAAVRAQIPLVAAPSPSLADARP